MTFKVLSERGSNTLSCSTSKFNTGPVVNQWNTPLKIDKDIKQIDPNSLVAFTIRIHKEISNRAKRNDFYDIHHDLEKEVRFQERFVKYEDSWNKLVEKMIKIASNFDAKYSIKLEFFDLMRKVKHDFSNILLSFIVIGPETKEGSGFNETKDFTKTVSERIDDYLNSLPKTLLDIKEFNKQLEINKVEHLSLIKERNDVKERLEEYKLKIKNCKKNIEKLKSIIVDLKKRNSSYLEIEKKSEEIKTLECQIELDELNLKEIEEDLENVEKKIDSIVNSIDFYKKEIKNAYSNLLKKLNFEYFIHEDWFPSLDFRLTK